MSDLEHPYEAEPGARFGEAGDRQVHLYAHVLNRSERWWEVLPEPVAAAMRDPGARHRLSAYGRRSLGEVYETTLAAVLHNLCAVGEGHDHFIEEESESGNPVTQTIKAWHWATRIHVIAQADVSNGTYLPYHLTTGYRPDPTLDREAWDRKRAERRDREERASPHVRLLAIHDAGG